MRDAGVDGGVPVVLEIKFTNGKTDRIKLPVEIWERNISWTFKYNSKDAIESVTYDPDKLFPDFNASNNKWSKK